MLHLLTYTGMYNEKYSGPESTQIVHQNKQIRLKSRKCHGRHFQYHKICMREFIGRHLHSPQHVLTYKLRSDDCIRDQAGCCKALSGRDQNDLVRRKAGSFSWYASTTCQVMRTVMWGLNSSFSTYASTAVCLSLVGGLSCRPQGLRQNWWMLRRRRYSHRELWGCSGCGVG